MTTISNISIYFLATLLFTNCDMARQSNLAGQWIYNNTIWYTSELTLNDDGTFKFHDQSCSGQNWTAGQWVDSSGIAILSSYKSFNLPMDNLIIEVSDFQTEEKIKAQTGKTKYAFTPLKMTIPKFNFYGPQDSIKVYFDDIRLQLTKDTLNSVTENAFVLHSKFSRTKNNRYNIRFLVNVHVNK